MKRTTAPNNASNLYVDQTGSVPGTSLTAEDRNNLQEEICNLIEDHGETLSGASDTQLVDVLGATADVTHNDITANGILKANDYFQMRTPTSYSTGSIGAGLSVALPIGWYEVNGTVTAGLLGFRSVNAGNTPRDSTGGLVTGGMYYSNGTLQVHNPTGAPQTGTYLKY